MSSEHKPYPASELKLERLRREGVIPVSLEFAFFALLLGAALGGYVLVQGLSSTLEEFATSSFSHKAEPTDVSARVREGMLVLAKCGVYFFVPLLFVFLVVSGLQTKFLFSFAALRVRFGRLFSFDQLSFGGMWLRCAGTFLRLCVGVLWIAFCGAVFWFLIIPQLNEFFMYSPGGGKKVLSLVSEVTRFGLPLVISALAFAGVIGGFALLLMRYRFFSEHRMSRAEVEKEHRETEAPRQTRVGYFGES